LVVGLRKKLATFFCAFQRDKIRKENSNLQGKIKESYKQLLNNIHKTIKALHFVVDFSILKQQMNVIFEELILHSNTVAVDKFANGIYSVATLV